MQPHAQNLFDSCTDWAMRHWDRATHMVWNPPGGSDDDTPAHTRHLVPNTAWLAYALLARNAPGDRDEALRAISAIVALQYDELGTAFHGTYAQFLESPHPPENPTVWLDYDPNWRQFVGTTLALILNDFESTLPVTTAAAIERSIGLAVLGEPDGRIPVHYTNPALMRAWLDAWYGQRTSDVTLIDRGIALAEAIVTLHGQHAAFDEFNSPTYSGIDLYALALWSELPPTPWFATAGAGLTASLWQQADDWFHAPLRNWCGPFTRSYFPDATRSVTLLALWHWARDGFAACLPALSQVPIDHCHDLMAGPVIARLASAIPTRKNTADVAAVPRELTQKLNNGREIHARIYADIMIGIETSPIDWGGWSQAMPFVMHWVEHDDAVGCLWLDAPHRTALAFLDPFDATSTPASIRVALKSSEQSITLRSTASVQQLDQETVVIGNCILRGDHPPNAPQSVFTIQTGQVTIAATEGTVDVVFVLTHTR